MACNHILDSVIEFAIPPSNFKHVNIKQRSEDTEEYAFRVNLQNDDIVDRTLDYGIWTRYKYTMDCKTNTANTRR